MTVIWHSHDCYIIEFGLSAQPLAVAILAIAPRPAPEAMRTGSKDEREKVQMINK